MAKTESEKRGVMDWYFKTDILLRILIALVLGAIVGLLAGPAILWVKPFGDIFIRLLRMVVMPLVLFSLVVGAASLAPARLGKIGVKIMLYYIVTTMVAISIALVVANILRPGDGLNLSAGKAAGRALTEPKIVDTLLGLIPDNVIDSLAKGQVLPIIFFGLVFGLALSFLSESKEGKIRESAATVLRFFDGAAEVIFKIVRGIMQYAPIGVFALIAVVFAQQGTKVIGPLAKVTVTVYIALIIHVFLIYGGLLTAFRLSFKRFLSGAKEAMLTAFVTRSSAATLPVTLKNSEENLGIPRSVGSFTLPLGATINMDGSAIYQAICAIFVALAVGISLDFSQQLTIILVATLASIGAAPIPGAGAIMLLMVLSSVGLEIKEGTAVAVAYAMILGIDAILDMGRTCVNVTGDLAGTSIVAKTEKELDLTLWKKA